MSLRRGAGGGPAGTNTNSSKGRAARLIALAVASISVLAPTGGVALAASAGDLDSSFGGDGRVTTNAGIGADVQGGFVDIARQTDGKLVAVANANSGDNSFAVVRFNADGTRDLGFGTGGEVRTTLGVDPVMNSIAIQADGRIVAAGANQPSLPGDPTDFIAVRYLTDGSLDASFGGDGVVQVGVSAGSGEQPPKLAVAPGKVVLAGRTLSIGSSDAGVVVLDSSGTPDPAFAGDGTTSVDLSGNGGSDYVTGVAIQSDGKVVVGGGDPDAPNWVLARWNTDGTPDAGFGTGGLTSPAVGAGFLGEIAIDSTGRLLATGDADDDLVIAAFEPDGDLDPAFGTDGFTALDAGGSDQGRAIAFQGTKIIVQGGVFTGTNNDVLVARFSQDGFPDTDADADPGVAFGPTNDGFVADDIFGSDDDEFADGVVFDPVNTRIVVAGQAFEDFAYPFLLGLDDDGARDAAFGDDGLVLSLLMGSSNDSAVEVAAAPGGKLVAAGNTDLDGKLQFVVARYMPDGALDPSFSGDGIALLDPGPRDDNVGGLAVAADGSVLVGGSSEPAGDDDDFAVGRLTPAGAPDGAFGSGGVVIQDIGGGNDDTLRSVSLGPGGSIFLGGDTCTLDDCDFAVIALEGDGDPLASFGGGTVITDVSPSVSDSADYGNDLAVRPDGSVIAAGASEGIGGLDTTLVGYTPSGGLDPGFGSAGVATLDTGGDYEQATGVALEPGSGKIVTTGLTANGPEPPLIATARFTASGDPDPAFGGGDGVTTTFFGVFASGEDVAIDGSGRAVVGGMAQASDGFGIAVRYTPSGALDTSFSGDGVASVDFGGQGSLGFGVATEPDSDVVLAGLAFTTTNQTDLGLARFKATSDPVVPVEPGQPPLKPKQKCKKPKKKKGKSASAAKKKKCKKRKPKKK